MELRGKHVLLPNRGGEAFAVSCQRRDDRWVNRMGKKAVHEINVTAARNITQNRTIRPGHFDLVPANLGIFNPGFSAKRTTFPWKIPSPAAQLLNSSLFSNKAW